MNRLRVFIRASNIFILSLCILLVALSNCKRSDPPHVYMPTELKEHILFDTGSYWVYKSINVNQIDCVVVAGVYPFTTAMTNGYHDRVSSYRHNYILTWNNYHPKHGFSYSYYQAFITSQYPNDQTDEPTVHIADNRISSSYLLLYPLKVNIKTYIIEVLENAYIDSMLPELKIDTFVFKNVIRFYSPFNTMHRNQPTRYYFARNYGVVRMDLLKDNDIWELNRWKLNLIE